MLVAALKDIRKKEISLAVIIICGCLSLISTGIKMFMGESLVAPLTALLPGVLLLVTGRITREGVGYGDGLLLMAIGPVFGLEHIVFGCFAGLFVSSIISIFILISKKGNRKTKLAFVPFLAMGMGVMMLA